MPLIGRPILALLSKSAESYPSLPQEDLQKAVGLLEKKSRSFWVASAGFGAEVREKLVALYVAQLSYPVAPRASLTGVSLTGTRSAE